MKVSDYIACKLVEFGITQVFCVTGGGAMHLNDSLANHPGLNTVFNHHEQACAIAAEGYFRASGKIACVNVTTGPGGLNALTGVMGQWTDSIPAIYVSGQVKFETTAAAYEGLGVRQVGDQEIDIVSIVRPLVKYAVQLRNTDDIGFEIEKAFSIATTARMGPVWLDVPMNIQGAILEEARQKPYVVDVKPPMKQAVADDAATRLLAARNPLIVAGHGIRLSPGGISAFSSLLSAIPIPVVTTFNGFDLVPENHPLYVGRIGTLGTRAGNFALQSADTVLFLGTRNNIRQVSYNWGDFAKRAFKMVVDVDQAELKKPTMIPDLAILADAADFCDKLTESLRGRRRSVTSTWIEWCMERRRKYPSFLPEYSVRSDGVHPYSFMKRLTCLLAEGTTTVAGNGTACVALFQAGEVAEGRRYFWNSGCASMGYDLPASLGAAVALRGRPVVCIAGDGSLQMNIQELATIAHLGLPVKIFYLNNDGYSSIKQTQDSFFGRRVGCDPASGVGMPSIMGIAKGYGLNYSKIASEHDIEAGIKKAMTVGGPSIVEVVLTRDYIFAPKLSSQKLPDGTMVSKPLEDMYPFLPRQEVESNIFV
jgi:acetolactate synthase I/II/III large subunit